jgi:uncharacterized membrane protein YphA (DoxX/SURF4 family)
MAGIFVYAGYAKLTEPSIIFEAAVDSYHLLPAWAVIRVAQILPWMEIGLGVLILVGWKIRYFATFATLLLGFFITLMAINFSRGTEAMCGCFGGGEPVSAWTLMRDSSMLVVALYLAGYSWKSHFSGARPATLATTEPAH